MMGLNKVSRDSWLAVLLLGVLTLVTAVAVIRQTQETVQHPPLANFSTQPNGANALRQWLEKLGYRVSDTNNVSFTIPDATRLLLLLEPTTTIQETEWEQIDEWVASGGTLWLVGSGAGSFAAFRHYEYTIIYQEAATATLQLPLFDSPPLPGSLPVQAKAFLRSDRQDVTVHLSNSTGEPLLVSFPLGEGWVVLSSAWHPFSNQGLQESGNAELLLNLFNMIPTNEWVWFDEWHHGVRGTVQTSGGPWQWARETAVGRALLFCGVLFFLAIVLRGRNFGRPVPLSNENGRRAPLEYITAVSHLSRRAGHKTAVLQDYHFRLKRELGHRYRLPPSLPDTEFVNRLAEYNPNLDKTGLQNLLNRLSQTNVSESAMVHLAAEVADWLKKE